MRRKKWIPLASVILAIQLAFEGFLLYELLHLNILPDKYLYLVLIFLIIALLITGGLLFAGIGHGRSTFRRIRRILAVILALIVCSLSGFVSAYLNKAGSTLSSVTDTDEKQTVLMGVYVMQDSPLQSIGDLSGKNTAVISSRDGEYVDEAVNEINGKVDTAVATTDFGSVDEAAQALYDGSTDALLMNEGYVDLLVTTDAFSEFDTKTRLLYEIKLEKKEDEEEQSVDTDLETDPYHPFIMYISGSDTRNELLDVSRSDVNIIMAVNPRTKQILLVNTPRDYFVPNPAGNGALDKLTHLGIYGINCSMAGLSSLYGVHMDYYAQINFTGFETLIDAIGGITVNSDTTFSTGEYDFVQGPNEMDGKKALAFSRDRYNQASGDNARGDHQMMVIEAVIQKLTGSGTTILTKWNQIMDSLAGMFQTNMSSDKITSLVKMQLNDMSSWSVQRYAVTGTGGTDYTYSMPSTPLYVMYEDPDQVAKASEMITQVMNGQVLLNQ